MESAQEEVKFPCTQCKKKNKQKRSLKTHIDSAHEKLLAINDIVISFQS